MDVTRTLEWNERDPNTQPDLDHYVVFWGTSTGDYTDNSENHAHLIGKDDSEYIVVGLSADTTYYFAVRAYDNYTSAEYPQGRPSEYSNEVTAILDTVAPAPPQNLTIWQKIIAWLKSLFGMNGFRFA